MKKFNINVIKKMTIFFIFFPFLNVVPFLPFETAPYAGLFSLIGLFMYRIKKDKKVKESELYFLLFVIIVVVYVRIDKLSDGVYVGSLIRTLFSLILGFSVFSFLTYSNNVLKVHFKQILNYVYTWIIIGFLQITPLKVILEKIFKVIMTRSQGGDVSSSRGIQILANEPSYAGIYLVSFLILIDYFKKNLRISNKKAIFLKSLIIILIILTKSSNAMLLFLFYIVLNIVASFKKNKKVFIILSMIIVLIVTTVSKIEFNSRAFNMLKIALNNPTLLLEDQSLASRYYLIYISYYGFFRSYGLGNGAASYSFKWQEYVKELHLDNIYEIKAALAKDMKLMPMSFFGGILHDFGVVSFIIFIVLIFKPLKQGRTEDKKYLFIVSGLITFLWLQTCSYALPMPWFLLGINYNLSKDRGGK